METGHVEPGDELAFRRHDGDQTACLGEFVARRNGRLPFQPEVHHAPGFSQAAPEICKCIVVVEQHGPGDVQTFEYFALGVGNGLGGTNFADMRGPGVVDQCRSRFGQPRQVGDLAQVVHTHFDHGEAMLGAKLQQCQRHADVVIKVAGCGKHAAFAGGLAQDRGKHLLDRGLAVASGNRDQRHCKACAPVGRKLAQRNTRISHHQQPGAGSGVPGNVAHHCCDRAGGECLRGERLAVETFATNADEQIAGTNVAAICGHAHEFRVAADSAGAERQRCAHKVKHGQTAAAAAAKSPARLRHRRKAAAGRRFPDRFRGLCPRATPRPAAWRR